VGCFYIVLYDDDMIRNQLKYILKLKNLEFMTRALILYEL
jgi:hypothetical protein